MKIVYETTQNTWCMLFYALFHHYLLNKTKFTVHNWKTLPAFGWFFGKYYLIFNGEKLHIYHGGNYLRLDKNITLLKFFSPSEISTNLQKWIPTKWKKNNTFILSPSICVNSRRLVNFLKQKRTFWSDWFFFAMNQ